MSRRENEVLYVPRGGGHDKSAVERFIEAHKLPSLRSVLLSAAAAFVFSLVVILILLLTGMRFSVVSNDDGLTYRYFGWILNSEPTTGLLRCSDGSSATVSNGDIHYSDGSEYRGKLSDFMKHGNGTLRFSDGSVYTGSFFNGLFNGHGEFIRTDGSGYIGNYTDGKPDGEGKLLLVGGGSYTGSFSEGEKSGNGIIVYSNGDSFSGTFIHDMRVEGIYTWCTGESIEGVFRNNTPEPHNKTSPDVADKIIYTDPAGNTYKAFYIDGSLSEKTSYTKSETEAPVDTEQGVG